MPRTEFSKQTKREALKRSGGKCEASGTVYGLEAETRCSGSLAVGVEFDHWPVPATDKGSDTLENCMAVCKTCHRWKTSHYDVPMQAKGKRIRDKHTGVKQQGSGWSTGKKSGFKKKLDGSVVPR